MARIRSLGQGFLFAPEFALQFGVGMFEFAQFVARPRGRRQSLFEGLAPLLQLISEQAMVTTKRTERLALKAMAVEQQLHALGAAALARASGAWAVGQGAPLGF